MRVPQKSPKVFSVPDTANAPGTGAVIQLLQIVGAKRPEFLTSTVSNLYPDFEGVTPKKPE